MYIEKNRSSKAKRRKNRSKDNHLNQVEPTWKPPKNWKYVYLRSEKLRRAKQLGIEYPRKSPLQLLNEEQN